ncbi:hypothetical protein BJX65DRAFT_308168 [Aspergillus insuetus]
MLATVLQLIYDMVDPWKAAAILLLFFNLKCLPFVWHYRIFSPIIRAACRKNRRRYHATQPLNGHADDITKPTPSDGTTPTVFLPFITTTHAPLLECDYNLHKSNSTYFTDLDASRSHLLSALCYRGLRTVDRELTAEGKPGILAAIIGSVTTSFKREIPMFRQYEVWSRVLAWDRKWIFIVTHFVKKGGVQPKGFLRAGAAAATVKGEEGSGQSEKHSSSAVVYATSVSKYVFKKGRLTVPPERVLHASGLLHQGGLGNGCRATTDIPQAPTQNEASSKGLSKSETNGGGAYPSLQYAAESGSYSDTIERQRLRGLQFAEAWAKLDVLHDGLLTESEASNGVVAIGRCNDMAGIVY